MGIKMKTSLTRTFYKFLVCLLGGLCLSIVVPFACMMFASSIGLVTLADNNERQTKALVPILTATPNVSDIHFPTGTKFLRLTKNYGYIDTNMSEEEKEEFLSMFDEDNKETHVGFCVLGGHFSEGIDLTNDKLIGVIIVGVGMPQIGIEREIIKDHMKDSNKGFDYAYVYPGMIKVLQAAGRCIRTDDDKGVILLLDNRYSQRRYQSLFPYEWYPNFRVRKSDDVKTLCEEFWNK